MTDRLAEHNLHIALRWQQAGVSIFVAGPDKKPRVKWRDVSTTDPDQIKEWFKQWPDALPAIDLAKSGQVILDGDRHGGPDGVSAAEQLFAERSLNMAAIPTVITPQDGRHYWFLQPSEGEPLGNSDKAIRDKAINVRGAGGYVIAPERGCRMAGNTSVTPTRRARLKRCGTEPFPSCHRQSKRCCAPTGTAPPGRSTATPAIRRPARAKQPMRKQRSIVSRPSSPRWRQTVAATSN